MTISIKNGLWAGVICMLIFFLPIYIKAIPVSIIGILTIAVMLLFMWNTAKSFKDRATFREHVREPFITFLITNVLFFIGRMINAPQDAILFSRDMVVLFPFGLILGFVLAGIITFTIRKMT